MAGKRAVTVDRGWEAGNHCSPCLGKYRLINREKRLQFPWIKAWLLCVPDAEIGFPFSVLAATMISGEAAEIV